MSKGKRKVSAFERYLRDEIGIEFKACLYFFAMLFFYCVYRVVGGVYNASILHMAELILMTYGMGYLQVYVLSNFDEAERLGKKEVCYLVLCSLLYTGSSWLFGWFDRQVWWTVGFLCYTLFEYVCAFWVYSVKRKIDEKVLNEDLRAFQERRSDGERN